MSQPSSNQGGSVFDEVDFQASEPTEGYDPNMEDNAIAAVPQQQYRRRSFDIYSVMLIISFVLLTTAAVVLFMDAEKY
jgi:hypothetical protein